jgi:hypothetical protein
VNGWTIESTPVSNLTASEKAVGKRASGQPCWQVFGVKRWRRHQSAAQQHIDKKRKPPEAVRPAGGFLKLTEMDATDQPS